MLAPMVFNEFKLLSKMLNYQCDTKALKAWSYRHAQKHIPQNSYIHLLVIQRSRDELLARPQKNYYACENIAECLLSTASC